MVALETVCAALLLAAAPLSAQEASTSAPTAVFVAVGDIRLDGPVGDIIRRDGPEAPTSAVRDLLQGDIVTGNLECPLTSRGTKTAGKKWTFRAPPKNLAALKAAGFNLLGIANNHVMDYGPEGFFDTLAALDRFGLPYVGGGKDRADAMRLKVVTVRGLRVGVLAFTSTFPESAWAGPRKPGVAASDYAGAGDIVREARARCDVLVVLFHGGTELAEEPNEVQKAFGRLAVESGADVFIGHHPHVIQPLEVHQGKPIIYSLGNFLFVSPTPTTRLTAAVRLTLSARGVEEAGFTALETNWGRPVPADAERREELLRTLDRYGALSAEPERFRVLPAPALTPL